MNLTNIIARPPCPAPWTEGEKIPWHEPEFSRRMLREHLSQAHDLASRRSTLIDQHVAWIHTEILQGKPAHILDLGCGPGFYCNRLAALGHSCTGIDFSPASIGYAQGSRHPNARFVEGDLRITEFGSCFDLAMLVYGEFNVFRPQEAQHILQKASAALNPGGSLLLEVHTFEFVQQLGMSPTSWYSAEQGVFADQPYLCLTENFWHAEQKVAVERFYILEAESAQVQRYSQSIQAYQQSEYEALLKGVGFAELRWAESLRGKADEGERHLRVVMGKKGSND